MIRPLLSFLAILLTALMLVVSVSQHALASAKHCEGKRIQTAAVSIHVSAESSLHHHAAVEAALVGMIDQVGAQDDLQNDPCCMAGGCPCAMLALSSGARVMIANAIIHPLFIDQRTAAELHLHTPPPKL